MIRVSFFILLMLFAPKPSGADEAETVFLLHGLGRTSVSMFLLAHRLESAGYQVISGSYGSTAGPIEDHVAWLQTKLEKCCRGKGRRTHFVTHSLGGIILRQYLAEDPYPDLGRVVMLSPPNQGSELVDWLKEWKFYQWSLGPSAQQLGTDGNSAPNQLGPVSFELGVVAGDVSLNPLISRWIPGPDDGKVSVERAKVEGMKDFLVVHHSHTFIMNSPEVADQVIAFLRTGAFVHSETIEPQP